MNATTLLPLVVAIVPHVLIEGTPWQMCFASDALKGTFRAHLAHEMLHRAGLSIMQRVFVERFVAACVPTTTLASV